MTWLRDNNTQCGGKTKMTNIQRINKIIFDQLEPRYAGVDSPDEIQSNHKIEDDLGADSLDLIEMLMALEEEFEIEIADEDAEKMATVKDVQAYLALCDK